MTTTHQRQLIRQAIQTALIGTAPTYATAAQNRVYSTRVVPWHRVELPAISLYVGDEEVTPESVTTSPRELERHADIAIEVAVNGDSGVDDALDALSLQIERAMDKDPTFGAVASNTILGRSTIELRAEGDKIIGMLRMVYTAKYFTYAPDPSDTTFVTLNTANINYNLNDQQAPADQAVDTLTNLEN